jgi:hypothetical protein
MMANVIQYEWTGTPWTDEDREVDLALTEFAKSLHEDGIMAALDAPSVRGSIRFALGILDTALYFGLVRATFDDGSDA